ncbi:hypothetical protein BSM4216_2496 [Bacillus smithii]|nr:hypothetical protein BSM4216_2496 [Bacillus smithii]
MANRFHHKKRTTMWIFYILNGNGLDQLNETASRETFP